MVIMAEILEKYHLIAEELKRYNINEIEFLPYHNLGKNKYQEINKSFHQFKIPTTEDLIAFGNKIEQYSIIFKLQNL